MKKYYALIVIHTGEFKTLTSGEQHINNVKENDLIVFNTKKKAKEYIQNKCAWALMPMKVFKNKNRWLGQETNYRL